MPLELKLAVETNLRRVSYIPIQAVSFTVTFNLNNCSYTSNKTDCFSYKGGCGVRRYTCIKVIKTRPGLGYR